MFSQVMFTTKDPIYNKNKESPSARTETLNNESALERRSLHDHEDYNESPGTLSATEQDPTQNPCSKASKSGIKHESIVILPAPGAEKDSADAAEQVDLPATDLP